MLTLMFQAIVPRLARSPDARWFQMSFDAIEILLHAGAFLITGVLLLLARREVLHWLRSLPRLGLLTIGIFLAWALLSVLWSDAPGRTLFQFGGIAGATAVALWLAWRFGGQGLLELLALWSLVIGTASYLVVTFAPEIGIMGAGETGIANTDVDRWRGVFHHKNLLGTFGALGAAVWVVYTAGLKGVRLLLGLGVIFALSYLMARAEAVAPLVGLGAFIVAFALLAFWRGLSLGRITLLTAALAAGFYAAISLPQWPTIPLDEKRAAVEQALAQAMQRQEATRDPARIGGITRDIRKLESRLRQINRQLETAVPDLQSRQEARREIRTEAQVAEQGWRDRRQQPQPDAFRAYSRNPDGRTRIWDAALTEAWNRPILGHGLGGFWRGQDGPSAALRETMPHGWIPRFGHAFWVDVILDLGVIGTALFALMLLWPGATGLRQLHVARKEPIDADGILLAGILALMALVLVRYSAGGYLFHSGPWVLVVVLVLMLHRLVGKRVVQPETA
ncbi:hypothetical protein THITH_04225 [Thioalkalivibrio paradoxus ARh 1]|uniref:Polymerase n=1 Tax=Thioalkalivibrio paradoxus ARh 1 TaxID=713585 RepID=W0DRP2_9GAMM|nr:hypothetical protein THITH_04225 [Thioalkalivibrio paradoxus ARh 1]